MNLDLFSHAHRFFHTIMKNGCLRGFLICAVIAISLSYLATTRFFKGINVVDLSSFFMVASFFLMLTFPMTMAVYHCLAACDAIFTSDEESDQRQQAREDGQRMDKAKGQADLLPLAQRIVAEREKEVEKAKQE